MRSATILVLCLSMILANGCKGGKARGAGVPSGSLEAFGEASDMGIGDDTYIAHAFDLEGKYFLYALRRDPKEGWGFEHGNELYSYNFELKLKLPMGKLGRSDQFGFTMLGEKQWLAMSRTVDSDGNGDVDERDGNQLYIAAPDGLDEEPVSPVGQHVTGWWGDPRAELVYYTTCQWWEGKRIKEKDKDKEPDPTLEAFAWSFETKETVSIGRCAVFYGPSPDGEQSACVEAGAKLDGSVPVTLVSRDGKARTKVTIPTTIEQQILPLGGGRIAYTKLEKSATGERRTLWVHGADGKDVLVTSPSVDTTIVQALADGGLVFLSRAEYSTGDGSWVRALSGDASRVLDLYSSKGTQIIAAPAVSPDGKRFAWLSFPAVSFEGIPKGLVMLSQAGGKPPSRTRDAVAGDRVPGLGETMVAQLRKALGEGSGVELDGITVDVRKKRAVMPLAPIEPAGDDAIVGKALALEAKVAPLLSKDGYDGVFTLEALKDAVAVLKWHPEYGKHLTYLVAYDSWLPVREEYDLVVEDMQFKKLPGCADPRMVQLHCAGWLTTVRDPGAGSYSLVCRATPLDPNQKIREGKQAVTGLAPGAEAITFDVIADKVDPRRSNRSAFDLVVMKDGKPVPFFDASWWEATRAWIDFLRSLPTQIPGVGTLEPFALGDETVKPLATWYPSSVVRQEQHLDLHLKLEGDVLPAIENSDAWNGLAFEILAAAQQQHTMIFDPDNTVKGRVTLYSGPDLLGEAWHKTEEEVATEGCENEDPEACWKLAGIYEAHGKKQSAEMTLYMACDLGHEEACAKLSPGAEAPAPDGKQPPAPAPGEEGPGALKKKNVLPALVAPAAPAPTLGKSEIQEAIRANIEEVKFCFQKASVQGGQITVKMTVSAKGKVEQSSVKHSSFKNAEVESCVLQAVTHVTFPPTPDGLPMTVTYPFTYAP